MTIRNLLGLGLIAVAAGGACGPTDDDGATSHAAPVPEADLVTDLVASVCDGFATCCASRGFTFNRAGCEALAAADYDDVQSSSATVRYDAVAAGDCLAAIQASMAACQGSEPDAPACDAVFVGTVAPGGACTEGSECLDQGAFGTECESGVCVAHDRGDLGDDCAMTCTESGDGWGCSGSGQTGTAYCFTNDGLYCSSDSVCAQVVPLGGACSLSGVMCSTGAYCDTQTSQCAPLIPIGGDCTGAQFNCASGAFCSTSYQCTAQRPDGSACTDYTECLGGNCENAVCTGYDDESTDWVTAELCAGQSN